MLFQLGRDKNLVFYSDYLSAVIVLGMESTKKKPMTKKGKRGEKKKHKERRLKKQSQL
jgi:hypothetical protein